MVQVVRVIILPTTGGKAMSRLAAAAWRIRLALLLLLLGAALAAGLLLPQRPLQPAAVPVRLDLPMPQGVVNVGVGAAEQVGGDIYLAVNGGPAERGLHGALSWQPYLAVSGDDGRTWRVSGPLLEPPPGYSWFYAESLVRDGARWLLYGHLMRTGADMAHASERPQDWCIGVAESADLGQWRYVGPITRAADYPGLGALTNPSVLHSGDTWYMSVSECTGDAAYRIRLLVAQDPLGPFADRGVIIEPAAAQQPWYAYGAWDTTLLRADGRYWIVFGGKDAPERGRLRRIGLAWADRPEGPWHVLPEPIWSNPEWEVGGRSAVWPEPDGSQVVVLDYMLLHPWRVQVRAFRVRLAPSP
jgi:beta-xylosidase